MHTPRKLSAAATITAAIAGFGLCGCALIHEEQRNQMVLEQAAARYDPPPILNYVTTDPGDVWQEGGVR